VPFPLTPECRIFREGTTEPGNMLQTMVKGDIIINKYEQERCKMSLFSRNKITTKIESLENRGKITIDYYKVKETDKLKIKILKEIAFDKLLIAIDSKFQFRNKKISKDRILDNITSKLEKQNIKYKTDITKGSQSANVFGFNIKLNGDVICEDFIIWFAINKDEIEKVISILNEINAQYYFTSSISDETELMQKYEELHKDNAALETSFEYYIFDNTYNKQLVVNVPSLSLNDIVKKMQF
jgi:hypothetical protein